MKQEDSDIKEYFNSLKQSEAEQLEIPPFIMPEKVSKKQTYLYVLPMAIAASLLLFFGLPFIKPTTEIQNDTMLIILTGDTGTGTDNLMVDEISISNWESPTNILIQEFED